MTATVATPVRRSRLGRSTRIAGALFVTPYLVFLLAFAFGPVVYGFVESFVDERTGSGKLGFQNWVWVLEDFRFWPAVWNVASFILVWIPFMTIAAIAVALLLQEKVGKSTSVLRTAYILPGAVAGTAAVMIWIFMLTPQLSPFGPALRALGIDSVGDMFNNSMLPVTFALMAFATGAGGWVIIMFGALQSIPLELIEAARMDGAGPIRTAISIKLPLIRKYVYYMVILSFAGATQIFLEPMLVNRIEPSVGSPWWSIQQFGLALGFNQGDLGSSAVVAVMLLVVSLLAAFVLVRYTDFFETEVDG